MGKIKKLFGGGKVATPQYVIDAERRAKEDEAKAAADAAQAEVDKDYRKRNQRGKAGTILNKTDAEAATGRTLLGG